MTFRFFVSPRLSKAFLASLLALLLLAGVSLSLLLTQSRVSAQPSVDQAPELVVEKTVNTRTARPGDILTYTINITDTLYGDTIWLTDTLPTELVYITDSLVSTFFGDSSWGIQDNVITWTAKMGGNDATAQIIFSARISTTASYTELQNTAYITTSSGYSVEVSSENTQVSFEVGNLNNVDTRKRAMPAVYPPKAGTLLTYTITLNNDDDIGVPGVQVVDEIPALLTFFTQSVTHTTGSYVIQDDTITWTLDVATGPDTTETLSFQTVISPELSQTSWIINIAEISTPGTSFQRSSFIQASPRYVDLAVSKIVTPPNQVRPGDHLTYTVRISNTGDAQAHTVWLTDTLPTVPLFNADSLTATRGSFGENGGVITWNVTTWPAGTLLLPEEEVVLSYTMQVPPTWTENVELVNTAQITGDGELQEVQASVWVIYKRYVYLPIVFKRWPPIPYPPVLSLEDPGEGNNDYTVQWTHDHPQISVVTYTLQEADSANFTDETEYTISHTGVENDRIFNDKPDGTYYYRVRGYNQYGYGAWSNVEVVTIRTLPYAPSITLNDPEEGVNDYTVRWSYDHPNVPVVTYTLQEANNANLSGATAYIISHAGVDNEKAFNDKPDGTYYYRVRGHNAYGAGDWSDVESVVINAIYYDNFENSGSGWPIKVGDMEDDDGDTRGQWHLGYRNGEYRIYIENADGHGPWDWFYQPDALAPYLVSTDKYCVETSVKFKEDGWWANMGLIFGANNANTDIYALCLYKDGSDSTLGWFLIRNDHYDFPEKGCARYNYKIEGKDRSGTTLSGWNKLQVGVNGDQVKVYIGGNYKGSWNMGGLNAKSRVGVIGGDYEITPVDIRFDYFKVLPNQSCTP